MLGRYVATEHVHGSVATVHYNVILKAIDVDGEPLDLPPSIASFGGNGGTIIDSGTTLAYLPQDLYNSLLKQITTRTPVKLHMVQETFACFSFTSNTDKAFPVVNLHFEDSLKLTVYPHDYLFSLREDMYCFGWQSGGMTTQDGSDVILLGDLVLSNKLVVYDLDSEVIGWADHNCNGSICWETILEGRIEGSAMVVGDFSQVVIGCYKGKLYFLDFSTGSLCWTFQAGGEIKCQPVVHTSSQLIWCGSHDHTLYALDYKSQRCVYKLQCGGSIFASPIIDEGHSSLYVASTSGRVTAVSIKDFPFHTLWVLELEAPIFGSLSIIPSSRSVICCLVDGQVFAISPSGSIIWKEILNDGRLGMFCSWQFLLVFSQLSNYSVITLMQYRTGGPIFAGPCMSHVLPSQVLVCCRNGSVYSLEPVLSYFL
ncbi:hypothetical protein F2Q69_00059270 [Brassica cretica]|uniref:Peptidase A1 domain-containing protein n=1 Tax=Brassica cretica TaxID=69181 RepID=A0A8S9RNT3_BRACR|nr:hypothetical protein F2Q69_00059270 [Brassica cretica]